MSPGGGAVLEAFSVGVIVGVSEGNGVGVSETRGVGVIVGAGAATYSGSILLNINRADNGTITAKPLPDRRLPNDTLNFTFMSRPPGFSTGSRTLSISVWVGEESAVTQNFGFNILKQQPTFGAVPLDVNSDGGPDRGLISPGVGDDFLWAIFPFPEPRYGSSYRVSDKHKLHVPRDPGLDVGATLDLLDAERALMKPQPSFLYGWAKGGVTGNGWANVPGTAAFGNTQTSPNRFQRTYAHELGHNFGFGHSSNTIAPSVGWDVYRPNGRLTLGHVKDTDLSEIMVPALLTHQAWIAAARYESAFNIFNATPPSGTPPDSVMHIPVGDGTTS